MVRVGGHPMSGLSNYAVLHDPTYQGEGVREASPLFEGAMPFQ